MPGAGSQERCSEEAELTPGFERWVRVAQIGRWEGHFRQKEQLVQTLKQRCVGEVARGEAGEKDVEATSDGGGGTLACCSDASC